MACFTYQIASPSTLKSPASCTSKCLPSRGHVPGLSVLVVAIPDRNQHFRLQSRAARPNWGESGVPRGKHWATWTITGPYSGNGGTWGTCAELELSTHEHAGYTGSTRRHVLAANWAQSGNGSACSAQFHDGFWRISKDMHLPSKASKLMTEV